MPTISGTPLNIEQQGVFQEFLNELGTIQTDQVGADVTVTLSSDHPGEGLVQFNVHAVITSERANRLLEKIHQAGNPLNMSGDVEGVHAYLDPDPSRIERKW